MKKLFKQPFKIIDDFFEAAPLWRSHALRQEYVNAEYAPGMVSASLDEINLQLFHSLASKLILHSHGKKYFQHLKVNYSWADDSFNTGWITSADPFHNVTGLIFLNPKPVLHSGISMYQKLGENDVNYAEVLSTEIASSSNDRAKLIKYKQDQENLFRKTMSIENVFNRCVLFAADEFHRDDLYFGNTIDTSRLVIKFSGLAK